MSRMVVINLAVVSSIGLVLAADSTSTRIDQYGLGVAIVLLLGLFLRGTPAADRRLVLWCVGVSTAAELFCTQIWELYGYRFGNVPLYVPPGHGLICLAAIFTARSPAMRKHSQLWTWLIISLATAWALLGLLTPGHPDIEGAAYMPIFLPLVFFTTRRLEYCWTFVLASLVELVGTHFQTWEWAAVQPWFNFPSASPPSVAAGGYCVFTYGALGCIFALDAVKRRLARLGSAEAGAPQAEA